MKGNLFFTILLASCCLYGASAKELTSGSVYRINCGTKSAKPTQAMTVSASGTGAVTAAINESDPRQQWYVTGNPTEGYTFRNVQTGAYLTSSNATSQQWKLTFTSTPDPANMVMALSEADGCDVIKSKNYTSSYAFAHSDGSNNVVCWTTAGSPNSLWNIAEVPMSDEQITAILDRFANTADEIAKTSVYQTHLQALFSDYACTELRDGVSLAGNEHYNALPPALRKMADKTASGNWQETNYYNGKTAVWDSDYARKYRVQLYEPYSEGSASASMAGIQAYTNMNNPTGIVADSNDLIYVMVDDDIPAGATLYIGAVPDAGMYNSVTAGTRLSKGLNTILCGTDNTHYFIYYTVTCASGGKPTQYKVTDFSPVKIHLEGGRVNGFFNSIGDKLYSADTREDFDYTSARATHVMYDLLGKYVILHFFLEDTPNLPGETPQLGVKSSLDRTLNPPAANTPKEYDPVNIIKAWDEMCFAERILMGIQNDEDIANPYNRGMYESIVGQGYQFGGYTADPGFYYSDYFNNRMMGITMQSSGLFMNATSWRTAYAPGTMAAILTQLPFGSLWGPAHEYGHMNQGPMKLAGTTEESNNIFSNVALFFNPYGTTSRCDYPSKQLQHFNNGDFFLENGTWGTTRMFWQLWCYYHATGHNKAFYPRLYELLRKNPIKVTPAGSGIHNPKNDYMHFAKMCCIAAGEDLTDFFTAWGFFVPLDHYSIDDYSKYDVVFTQEDIDAAKAEIAALGLPANKSIILIDDRPGSMRPTQGEFDKTKCGELGGLDAFSNPVPPSGNFGYMTDGTTVKITSENARGVVGYLIYDNEGNLLAFSNSNSFEVTPEVAERLMSGELTVSAMGAGNEELTVVNTVLDGSVEQKTDLLSSLMANCEALLAFEDDTETKVGYLLPKECRRLRQKYEEAVKLLASSSAEDGSKLTELYLALNDRYLELLGNDEARIPIEPGAAYIIVNSSYPNKGLAVGSGKLSSTAINAEQEAFTFESQWIFEEAPDNGGYYLRNMGADLYAGAVKKNYTEIPAVSAPQHYSLMNFSTGVFAFVPDNASNYALHCNTAGTIVHWSYSSDPSHWTITKVNEAEYVEDRKELAETIELADKLLYDTGSVIGLDPYEMTFDADRLYSNAMNTGTNPAYRFTSWDVLFDNNIATYFTSNLDQKDSEDGLDYYIRMKADEGETFRNFSVKYITPNSNLAFAKISGIRIDGSVDGETWHDIASVTQGLEAGAAKTNYINDLVAPKGTKYIRFFVTKMIGTPIMGHAYFGLSELHVMNRQDLTCTPLPKYKKVTPEMMKEVCMDIKNGRAAHDTYTTSPDDMKNALAKLNDSYATLLMARQVPTGFDDNEIQPETAPVEWFDLQGMPVENPTEGIYIRRQGNKTVKVVIE